MLFGLETLQAQTLLPIPPQSSTFGMTRGYWFTAPIDFTIVSIFVPTGVAGGFQSSQILRLPSAPPSYSAVTNTFTSLLYNQNVNSTAPISCNVPIANGDVIMILGARSTTNVTSSCTNTNSYGAYTGTFFPSSVCGLPMNLTRAGFQAHICRGPAADVWQEPVSNYYISRVELMYTCGILPVGLSAFQGISYEFYNELTWKAESETNFSHYEIERARKINVSEPISEEVLSQQMSIQTSDGIVQTVPGAIVVNTDDWQQLDFENVGRVEGQNQGNSVVDYAFKDQNPQIGYSYYRLKQVDLDGTASYSNVIEVLSGQQETNLMSVYPNPTAGECHLKVFSTETQNAQLEIFDLAGRQVLNTQYVLVRGENQIDLNLSALSSGNYLLHLSTATGHKFTKAVQQQ